MQEEPPSDDDAPDPSESTAIEVALDAVEVVEGELDENTERVARAAMVVALRMEERFRGPLPHPRHLAKYEEVLPGAAERVFAMAESEQRHRHAAEDRVITVEESLGSRGQKFALTVALAGLVASIVLGIVDQPVPSAVVGGSSLISLVGLFLTRRMGDRDDAQQSSGQPKKPEKVESSKDEEGKESESKESESKETKDSTS